MTDRHSAIKKNVFANYAGAAVLALAPMLALPWYLHALGPKQYGLVGFIAMLQGLLGLIDAGMSQALVREVAVQFSAGAENRGRVASLLFGFERIYWTFGLVAAAVLLLLNQTIVSHWLVLDGLPTEIGQLALYGAAAIFAVQFPGLVYRSLMLGAQAQVQLNKILMAGALLRHIGGVALLTLSPTLLAYILWNIGVSLAETLVRATFAWQITEQKRSFSGWDATQMRALWKIVLGMSGAALLGAVTVQMDKVIVSKMVSIEQFGYYMIAATVASGALQLVYPLVQASLPRAIHLRNDGESLSKLSNKLMKIVTMLVVCGAIGYFTIGEWLLHVWLKSWDVVNAIHPVLSILLIGTALNAFYNVGYIHWIVFEKLGCVFQVNLAAFLLSLTVIPLLVANMGMIGAAFGWVAINLIGLVLSLEWMKKSNRA